MRRLLVVLLLPLPALALSPEAREFMEISARLVPVRCEKRPLQSRILDGKGGASYLLFR